MTWWQETIKIVGGAVAGGGFVTVKDWLKERRGKLVLTVAPAERGKVRDAKDARIYRHLLVSNSRPTRPAHNVRVFVREVVVLEHGKRKAVVSCRLPLHYQWEPNDQRRQRPPRENTIGEPLTWDLCSIGRDTDVVRIETAEASWNWDPTELRKKKVYILTIEATSSDLGSKEEKIMIDWDGGWNDDTEICAERHLKVQTTT